MPRKDVFSEDGTLAHRLWVDEPDAHDLRQAKLARGDISADLSARLTQFIDHGYCTLDLGLAPSVFDDIEPVIDQLWKYRSRTVLAAANSVGNGRPIPISELDDASPPRFPGTRLLDSHSADAMLMSLYLNPLIHQTVRAIYDDTPVATQSLLFEYGSVQRLHRDPWFVVTNPVANLTAVWIALQDIDENSGPLTYVPGSHRLAHYQFDCGDLVFHDPAVSTQETDRARESLAEQVARAGLSEKRFVAKRGQAFIWHSGLVHGGSPVADESMTRRSLVVHFDKLKDHPHQGVVVNHLDGTSQAVYTNRLIEQDGCYGFEAPARQTKWPQTQEPVPNDASQGPKNCVTES